VIRVAAYQAMPAPTIELRYEQIHTILSNADALKIDFLCLPEGFLTGYYNEEAATRENSFHTQDALFQQFLTSIRPYRVTIIIGFNEREGDDLFDSAAIIESGVLLGVQRKHYRYHDFCNAGMVFTTFISKGMCFGVVVCLDSNYFEPSRLCALQGATVLFVPACNKVPLQHPLAQRPSYYSHFVARAHENSCWLVAADWIWPNDGILVCPGHSAIYNSDGQEVIRSKQGIEDMLIVKIPREQLLSKKKKRVSGSHYLLGKINEIIF